MSRLVQGTFTLLLLSGVGSCGKSVFHGSGNLDHKAGKAAPASAPVESVQEASQSERDNSVTSGGEAVEEVAANEQTGPVANPSATPSPAIATTTPPAFGPCSPKGKIPAGFTFDFDQKIGGALVLRGTSGDDVLAITGRNVAGEILLNGGPDKGGFLFTCVKSFVYSAGPGNDTILLGGPLRALDNVTVNGDAGSDNVTLTGNIGQVANVTVNGDS